MLGFDYATIIAAIMVGSLGVYALTGGADFGGGIWDLLARGPRAEQQRKLISRTIGPIWEANHVWLILVIVLMFVGFPAAFAAIMTALHIPLVLMLIGIVLRGSSFVFRSYGPDDARSFQTWSRVFAISSTLTPFFLGVTLGAVASGELRMDPATGQVEVDFFSAWLAPFPFALGAMVVILFAFLAAVYLVGESAEQELRTDFSRRAVFAGLALGPIAGLTALAAKSGAPHLWEVLVSGPTAVGLQVAAAILAIAAITAVRRERAIAARVLAGCLTVLLVFGWAISQQGDLLVGALSIADAAAPDSVLRPVTIALLIGMVALVPSFVVLYRVFSRRDADL